MKPIVDYDLCIGDAICAEVAPEVFEMRDDGLAHVIMENPGPEMEACVREACAACPTNAIILE